MELTAESDSLSTHDGLGVRHIQCFILFFTLSIAYSIRTSMGIALVAMTGKYSHLSNIEINVARYQVNNGTLINGFNETNGAENEDHFVVNGVFNALLISPPYPRFNWSKKTQDTILSSFFWGYLCLQILAGQLAHRFGAKRLLIFAMTVNCLMLYIVPVCSYYGGWICTLVCRFLQGVSQGCLYPSFHTFLGRWSPLEERGRLSGIIYGGQSFGTVLGLSLTGLIASSFVGWPGIYYLNGTLSGITVILIWFMLADTPRQHKTISIVERRFIENSLNQTRQWKVLQVPWKQILLSPGMLAIAIAHSGGCWIQVTLFSEMPSYMDKIMGVNIKANGLLNALPYMVLWITNAFFSWITDTIIVKKWLNVTHTRKLANTIGSVFSSLGLIAFAYAPTNIYVKETILIFTGAFSSASHFGHSVNHLDISPNFAGTMMSISNFIANGFGATALLTAGFILTDATDPVLWRKVFYVAAGFALISNLIYIILGTSQLADWNDPPQYDEVATDEKRIELKNIGKYTNGNSASQNLVQS